MDPADFTVHIAHAPPHIIGRDHFHREALAVIDPFDAVVIARPFAHIGFLVLDAREIGLGVRGWRRQRREREDQRCKGKPKAHHVGGEPISGESDSSAYLCPAGVVLIRRKTQGSHQIERTWLIKSRESSSRADFRRGSSGSCANPSMRSSIAMTYRWTSRK